MSLAPLLTAPFLVQAHVALGLLALLVGAARIGFPHPENADRALGWSFLGLLGGTAATALMLTRPADTPSLFGLTLGHAFIVATLLGLLAAVMLSGRKHRLRWRNVVTALFAGVLLMAGLFELVPGRVMHLVLAGG